MLRRSGPALTLGLAALAHGLVLGMFLQEHPKSSNTAPSGRQASTAAHLRLLTLAPPSPPAALAVVEPRETAQEKVPPAAQASAEPDLLQEPQPPGTAEPPTSGKLVLPPYPDAALPEGRLQLRRWLTLDREGWVTALQPPDQETAPEAFARATQRGLLDKQLDAGSLGLTRLPKQLCVELTFIEEGGRVQLRALPQLHRAERCLV